MPNQISIHALLAESDPPRVVREPATRRFLSTLSLRRATSQQPNGTTRTTYFYPRSPCGERRIDEIGTIRITRFLSTLSLRRATTWQRGSRITYVISIHALLAESDPSTTATTCVAIANFYPRSPCGERRNRCCRSQSRTGISIHALLAESDHAPSVTLRAKSNISIHALLAESDFKLGQLNLVFHKFLSTLSLRRATAPNRRPCRSSRISIHALLAESDH